MWKISCFFPTVSVSTLMSDMYKRLWKYVIAVWYSQLTLHASKLELRGKLLSVLMNQRRNKSLHCRRRGYNHSQWLQKCLILNVWQNNGAGMLYNRTVTVSTKKFVEYFVAQPKGGRVARCTHVAFSPPKQANWCSVCTSSQRTQAHS